MKGLKAFLKFVPVFVLAGLMIFGKGHLFDGQDAMIAAPLAFLAAVIIAMLVEKKMPDEYINAAGNGVTQAFMDWCAPLIGEPLEKLISLRDDGISPF